MCLKYSITHKPTNFIHCLSTGLYSLYSWSPRWRMVVVSVNDYHLIIKSIDMCMAADWRVRGTSPPHLTTSGWSRWVRVSVKLNKLSSSTRNDETKTWNNAKCFIRGIHTKSYSPKHNNVCMDAEFRVEALRYRYSLRRWLEELVSWHVRYLNVNKVGNKIRYNKSPKNFEMKFGKYCLLHVTVYFSRGWRDALAGMGRLEWSDTTAS